MLLNDFVYPVRCTRNNGGGLWNNQFKSCLLITQQAVNMSTGRTVHYLTDTCTEWPESFANGQFHCLVEYVQKNCLICDSGFLLQPFFLTEMVEMLSLCSVIILFFICIHNFPVEHLVTTSKFRGLGKSSLVRVHVSVQICEYVCKREKENVRMSKWHRSISRGYKWMQSACHPLFFLMEAKPPFKYLNDNAGVTLNPFSRFIKSSRKNEEQQSEKSKSVELKKKNLLIWCCVWQKTPCTEKKTSLHSAGLSNC